ncbi:hypothetical protein BASA81_011048 [Batrachochytrium salamandrivorans]|nr:hypothetical protein BASA81_011048 [Batrachochytrium salamandrivorans]
MEIDPVLEAFEKLRVREVRAEEYRNASVFLAKFQSAAASLEPDERIKLTVTQTRANIKSLKAVLSDPQASKICALEWKYLGKEDVNCITPLLNNCPELALLDVYFNHHSAFDFVSSVLEHPSNKIKVLVMPPNTEGDSARFFAALGQSQVSALTLCYFPKFNQDLFEYLARDLLVRLEVWMSYKRVPLKMMMSLATCTRLAKLKMVQCEFSQPTAFTHLPKSITKLILNSCTFVDGFDWSFLADSNMRELDLYDVKGVDGNQLGVALAAHLREKGLDKLCLDFCNFVNVTLTVVGVELGRIKRLDIDGPFNDASFAQIALALQAPNSEMRELKLEYYYNTMSGIENHLMLALRHPNCNLAKLSLLAHQHGEAARSVESKFRNRRALFALLQGQQVRRLYCPLRRLPVEMLRLVGMALI